MLIDPHEWEKGPFVTASAHRPYLARGNFYRDMALAAHGDEVTQVVGLADGVWNDVVHVQSLSLAPEVTLPKPAFLAGVVVSFPGRLSGSLPVLSPSVVLGCPSLPRGMLGTGDVRFLPRCIATLGAKHRLVGNVGSELAGAPLADSGATPDTAFPTSIGTKFDVSSRNVFKRYTARYAQMRDAASLRTYFAAPFVAAGFRAKALPPLVGGKRFGANLTSLFHGGIVAYFCRCEPEYQGDIARRMELATQPTKRAAVAKTKNNLDRPEDLPLFGGVI